jgi:hypothetical protein
VGHVDIRPELTDAARHEIRVPHEVGPRVERAQLVLALGREDAQVLGHPFDEHAEEGAHALSVAVIEGAICGQAVGQASQQLALGGQGLPRTHRRQDRGHAIRPCLLQLVAQDAEMADPLLALG